MLRTGSNLNDWKELVLLIPVPQTVRKTVFVCRSYAKNKIAQWLLIFELKKNKIKKEYSFWAANGRMPRGPRWRQQGYVRWLWFEHATYVITLPRFTVEPWAPGLLNMRNKIWLKFIIHLGGHRRGPAPIPRDLIPRTRRQDLNRPLNGLSGTKQSHQEGWFPFAFHRSSVRWPGREEVLLLPRWV